MKIDRSRRARWLLVGWSCLLLILVAGCSPPAEEPGLFGRHQPSPIASSPTEQTETTSGPTDQSSDQPVDPDLPVVGERIWTTGDGSGISFRIAVHALRRIDGATILDWSITPLPGDHLRPGDAVSNSVSLGAAGAPATFRLLDTGARRVYRPLRSDTGGCLCTRDAPLRAGRTALHELAFPPLPETTDTGDYIVDIPSVALFTDVLAVGADLTPLGLGHPALDRPADHAEIIRWSRAFDYNSSAGGQRMRIGIIGVHASSDATSVSWSIWTLDSGAGLTGVTAPPITAAADAEALRSVASGLRLRRPATGAKNDTDGGYVATWREDAPGVNPCLCSDLRDWTAGMTTARRSVTAVTNLPALPAGTRTIDVAFPGLLSIPRVAVDRERHRYTVTISRSRPERWKSPSFQSAPFASAEWPTPLPDSSMLARFHATVLPLR